MRLSPLLFLAGASMVSAQWGDYLNRILSPQKPLGAVEEVDQRAIIEKRVRTITSENWRSAINNTAATEDENVTAVAEEWLFYFTTSNVNGTRNATHWDGVFNVRILYRALFSFFFAFCFLLSSRYSAGVRDVEG